LLSCAAVARSCTTVIVRGMGPEEEEREKVLGSGDKDDRLQLALM